MKKIVLIAKESFSYPYGRKRLEAGESFEAESERDAHMLCVTGRAVRAEEKQDKPTEEKQDKPQRAGTYARRDMQATNIK